jgi:serine/threonine protein kinase
MNEKNLLSKLKHPFIVNMIAAFQDRDTLYLVMDYLAGGDMRYHLISNRSLKENEISKLYD